MTGRDISETSFLKIEDPVNNGEVLLVIVVHHEPLVQFRSDLRRYQREALLLGKRRAVRRWEARAARAPLPVAGTTSPADR